MGEHKGGKGERGELNPNDLSAFHVKQNLMCGSGGAGDVNNVMSPLQG